MTYIKELANGARISEAEVKKVIPGRIPDFQTLKNNQIDLEPLFESMGWLPFFSIEEPVYIGLVRQFWRTSQKSSDNHLIAIFGDAGEDRVFISHENLSEITRCPREGAVFSNTWLNSKGEDQVNRILYGTANPTSLDSKYLLPKVRVLHVILRSSIIPKLGSRDYVSQEEKFVMFNLLMDIKTDLIDLIMDQMIKTSQKTINKITYPYGMILTRLFRSQNVKHLNRYFCAELCTPINVKTLKLMKIDLETIGEEEGDDLVSSEATESDKETIAAAVVADRKGKRKVSEESSSRQADVALGKQPVLSEIEEEGEEEQGCELLKRKRRKGTDSTDAQIKTIVSNLLKAAGIDSENLPSNHPAESSNPSHNPRFPSTFSRKKRTGLRTKKTVSRRRLLILESSESSKEAAAQDDTVLTEEEHNQEEHVHKKHLEYEKPESPVFIPSPISCAQPNPEPIDISLVPYDLSSESESEHEPEPTVHTSNPLAEPTEVEPHTSDIPSLIPEPSSPKSQSFSPEPSNALAIVLFQPLQQSHQPSEDHPSDHSNDIGIEQTTPILSSPLGEPSAIPNPQSPVLSHNSSTARTEIFISEPDSPMEVHPKQNIASSFAGPSISEQLAEIKASVTEANFKIDVALANQDIMQRQLAAQQTQILKLLGFLKP